MSIRKIRKKSNKGFTLIELIIVVAILAILVGILAPQYTKYVEKSKRSADMNNAKAIETTLRLALTMDEIQVPKPTDGQSIGVWVMICRNKDCAPKAYRDLKLDFGDRSIWCGADKGVTVNGYTASTGYMNKDGYNTELENILTDAGISSKNFRTYSNGSSTGWNWIIVQVGYNKDGQLFSKIYSGYKNENGSINQAHTSNIENLMYGNS